MILRIIGSADSWEASSRMRLLVSGCPVREGIARIRKGRRVDPSEEGRVFVIIDGAFEYLHIEVDLFGFPAFVGLFPFLLSRGEEIDGEKQERVENAGKPAGTRLHGVHWAKSNMKRTRRGNTLNG